MFGLFSTIVPIMKVIVLLLFVVTLHEFGHYIICKLCKVKVLSVGLGIGPILYSIEDSSGTKWYLHAILIAAYVEPDNFYNDQYKQSDSVKNFLISSAGPVANILLSLVCFYALFSIRDIHALVYTYDKAIIKTYTVKTYTNNAQTHTLGIFNEITHFSDIDTQEGAHGIDKKHVLVTNISMITKIRFISNIIIKNTTVTFRKIFDSVVNLIYAGKKIDNQHLKAYQSELLYSKYIDNPLYNTPFEHSQHTILKQTQKNSRLFYSGKKTHTFKNIIDVIKEYSEYPFTFASILYIIAILSLGLGIFNLLPIPGLDGYHMLLSLCELLFRRKLRNNFLQYLEIFTIFLLTFFMLFKNILNQNGMLYKIYSVIMSLFR